MNAIVIDGFENLTRQQIFDMAVKHIGSTGVKSVNETDGGCMYGGTGCNARPLLTGNGAIIADSQFDSDWYSLSHRNLVPSHQLQFIIHLQEAHDTCNNDNNNQFKQQYALNMRQLAGKYSLNTESLDALNWG